MPVTIENLQNVLVSQGCSASIETLQDLIAHVGLSTIGDRVTYPQEISETEVEQRLRRLLTLAISSSLRNHTVPAHAANMSTETASITEDLTPVPIDLQASITTISNANVGERMHGVNNQPQGGLPRRDVGSEPVAEEEYECEDYIESNEEVETEEEPKKTFSEKLDSCTTTIAQVKICNNHIKSILYEWSDLINSIERNNIKSAFPKKISSNILKIAKDIDLLNDKYGVVARRVQQRVIANRRKKKIKKKEALNSPKRSSWFMSPIGIEYTFHLPKIKKIKKPKNTSTTILNDITGVEDCEFNYRGETNSDSSYYEELIQKVKKYLEEEATFYRKKTVGLNVYRDQGNVLEIGSPVHKSWKDMLWWYKKINYIAKEFNMVSWKPDKGGGGGHINVSLPNNGCLYRDLFVYNLITEITNKPYIAWIFNDPSDNHNAKSLLNMGDELRKISMHTTFREFNEIAGYKNYSINIKDEAHFEFRGFEMYRNKKDLFDIMKFVSNWLKHIDAISKEGNVIPRDQRVWRDKKYEKQKAKIELLNNTQSSSQRSRELPRRYRSNKKQIFSFQHIVPMVKPEFKKMLGELGLDYKDYSRFVRRNFEKRIKEPYGKKYLV